MAQQEAKLSFEERMDKAMDGLDYYDKFDKKNPETTAFVDRAGEIGDKMEQQDEEEEKERAQQLEEVHNEELRKKEEEHTKLLEEEEMEKQAQRLAVEEQY